MSRIISRAESWEKAYEAFSQINFTAFDFTTIRRSMVEYIKLYFPESFNDFIESSEFVALLDTFAYLGEQLIYRVDVSSHENFLPVAQRKQNVLRLAKLISYKATRNLPARGLLKITSVSTTESVFDSRGNALKGTTILWNDLQNSTWKEQFNVVLNAASSSRIGTVTPTERVQVDNVLFELYSMNNVYNTRGVLPYSVTVTGSNYNMEVVPVKLDAYGPSERRPEVGSALTFLYGADGFGNDSPTTGFFLFTKQGRLTNVRTVFDGKTPNQFVDLDAGNINDTDLWINNVDPQTGLIVSNGDRRVSRSGEWNEVDTTSAQNIVFSYTSGKNRYEVETLEDDRVRIIFGDGEFATIPSGTFDIWYRTSANENLILPQNAIVNQPFAIDYVDAQGQRQTLTLTASLISNVQNASQSEDIDHIRRAAPATYYSQNRMVSGADYNLFPLKDPSILKLRAINRTYVGESKFTSWNDASDTYQDVKMAGTDLALTLKTGVATQTVIANTTPEKVYTNYVLPALATTDTFVYLNAQHIKDVRRSFLDAERTVIISALTSLLAPSKMWIVYDVARDAYSVTNDQPKSYVLMVERGTQGWKVSNMTTKLVAESPSTNFWSINNGAVISTDTLTAESDKITVLKANESKYGTLLSAPMNLVASAMVLDDNGMLTVNKLEMVAHDSTTTLQQGINVLNELIDPIYDFTEDGKFVFGKELLAIPKVKDRRTNPLPITLPFTYVKGIGEVTIAGLTPPSTDIIGGYTSGDWSEDTGVNPGALTNKIMLRVNFVDAKQVFQVVRRSMVYYVRQNLDGGFEVAEGTDDQRLIQASEELASIPESGRYYKRVRGVKGLNFMWMHTSPSYHLIDPSFTNINDVFLIQRGYYANYQAWLDGTAAQPVAPTPLQLRNDYKELLANAMLSDTVVFHPGKLKLILGNKAAPELRATLLVVKNEHSTLTDSQIKLSIKRLVRDFFDVQYWEFGETFYFTELVSVIHHQMAADINSVVLVPTSPQHYFGDMFEVNVQEDEIVQADVDVDDIEIVSSLNAARLRQLR